MAAELLHNRNRALALGGAIALHLLVVAALVLFAPGYPAVREQAPGIVAVQLNAPPPPSPPPSGDIDEGASAPPSRGASDRPSPPEPPQPLAQPTPAEPSLDIGSAEASGAGAAPGSDAGQGGEGTGRGAGASGSGAGSGRLIPPVRITGELTNTDYRRVRPPEGAAGTVVARFRVDTGGRVERCEVIRSSGYAVFDEATCRLIRIRFRYRPARNESGQAIAWDIRTSYTWGPR